MRKISVLIARSTAIAPEPRVQRAANCIRRLGLSVHIVGWDRERRFPAREHFEDGISVDRVKVPGRYGAGLTNLVGLAILNLYLLWIIFRLRPCVYHAVDLDTLLPGLVAKRLFGARIFYDIADWYASSRPRSPRLRRIAPLLRLLSNLERWALRYADYICLPHESRLSSIPNALSDRVLIIYNSPEDIVDLKRLQVPKIAQPYFAYTGGLYEDRGITYLGEAARLANTRVALAGFGPLEAECRQLAAENPLVHFFGRVSYADALALQAFSAGVLILYDPTSEMNQVAAPYKLYEAMMLGKPIIGSDGTPPGELAQRENIGLSIPYGSSSELARAMRYLLDHQNEAGRMGRRARRLYLERYAWEVQCRRLQDAYLRLREMLGGVPVATER
jgi:glycosyltransferase involved in cell wall biosynthesis